MIKGTCDFLEESSLLYVTTLSGLVAIGKVVVEIKFLNYHVTSCDHVIKVLRDLMV